MDRAAVARHRLEAVEARTHSFCRAATLRCRPGSGGANRRKPPRPLAARKQPCAQHRHAKGLLRITSLGFHRGTAVSIIHRTAGYGPVRPVVWEGWRRKTPPYPDSDGCHSPGPSVAREPGNPVTTVIGITCTDGYWIPGSPHP